MYQLTDSDKRHLKRLASLHPAQLRAMHQGCRHENVKVPDEEIGASFLCLKCGYRHAYNTLIGA